MNYYNINGHDVNARQYTIIKVAAQAEYGDNQNKNCPTHVDPLIQNLYAGDMGAIAHDVTDLVKKGLVTAQARDNGGLFVKATEAGRPISEPSKSPLRVGYHRPAVSRSGDEAQMLPGIVQNALQTLADTPLVVNEEMRNKLNRTDFSGWTGEEKAVIKGILEWDGPIYSEAFCDWRGRAYNQSGTFGSYTQSKINRAMLDAPEATPIKYGSREHKYMITIIEKEFGINEKNWSKTLTKSITSPEDLGTYRAALAMKEVITTGKTAYMLEQDASCSGGQFVALLGGDQKLAKYTNLLPDSVKHDLYTFVTDHPQLREQLEAMGITGHKNVRNAAKPVVMLSFYGAWAPNIAINIWIENGGTLTTEETARYDRDTFTLEEAIERGCVGIPDTNGTCTWLGGTFTYQQLLTYVTDAAKRLDLEFPFFGEFKGRMKAWFNSVSKEREDGEYFSIEWVTPNGMLIERNKTKDDAGGTMPNFVHSIDAAVVHRVINQCAEEGITIKTVHDAFFTTPTNALRLKEIVAQCYASVIRDTEAPFVGEKKHKEGFKYSERMLEGLANSALIGEVTL